MDLQSKTQEFADMIRNWVHFDNLIAGFTRQIAQARAAKTRWETSVLEHLTNTNMLHAVIQISGSRLTAHNEKHTNPLTLTRLEDLLHDYYSKKGIGTKDETEAIIKHIRANRVYTSKTVLKKN
jgi:hypothetical protein